MDVPGSAGEIARPVVVIGAGAGGLMAAGRAAEAGAAVILLEKTPRPGNKLLLSGKTRCNLSNIRDLQDFIPMYGANGPFLYGAFRAFFREDLLDLLRRHGVETAVERGGRIFPTSGRAEDIVDALRRFLERQGAVLRLSTPVRAIHVRGGRVEGVQTPDAYLPAGAVVLATGGASWPETGSTGDGYRMARAVGHTIVPLRPALVPLVVADPKRAALLRDVPLKNVRLTTFQCPAAEIPPAMAPDGAWGRGISGRRPPFPILESRVGEMVFTHFGLAGSLTLLASLSVMDALPSGPVSAVLDLKPGLTPDRLHRRLQRDFEGSGQSTLERILAGMVPRRLVAPLISLSRIPADKRGHQVTATERERLVGMLKRLSFDIRGSLPLTSALVTAGGVSLREINPRSMGSRLVDGLFFCGEVMDIDADTGGYNLQAAFSTGYAAGEAAARHCRSGAAE